MNIQIRWRDFRHVIEILFALEWCAANLLKPEYQKNFSDKKIKQVNKNHDMILTILPRIKKVKSDVMEDLARFRRLDVKKPEAEKRVNSPNFWKKYFTELTDEEYSVVMNSIHEKQSYLSCLIRMDNKYDDNFSDLQEELAYIDVVIKFFRTFSPSNK